MYSEISRTLQCAKLQNYNDISMNLKIANYNKFYNVYDNNFAINNHYYN